MTRHTRPDRVRAGGNDRRDSEPDGQPAGRLARAKGWLSASVKRASFWAAVLLPVVHLSLLAMGVETTRETTALAALLAANVGALVVGHDHGN